MNHPLTTFDHVPTYPSAHHLHEPAAALHFCAGKMETRRFARSGNHGGQL